ncbi:MAG: antitoxin family protein [Pirellulales bacterium]|nr:antitoxin family protein [Pirellulales bacterium]
MIKKIDAIFDGNVLRPAEPLEIAPNTRVKITVDVPEAKSNRHGSFLDTAQELNLDGPADWSENIDSYLYREPSADA